MVEKLLTSPLSIFATSICVILLSTLETSLAATEPVPTTSNCLWSMGSNTKGQLGDGSKVRTNIPTYTGLRNIRSVASGYWHTLFVTDEGALFVTGDNYSGQLGIDTTDDLSVPLMIVESGVVAAAAGDDHSLFLKADGSLWGMGTNSYGQLGGGDDLKVKIQTKIVQSDVTSVAAGAYHTIFTKSDGSLWGMGSNNYGRLGLEDTDKTLSPTMLFDQEDVVAVACGQNHSLFITADGSLWGMGSNSSGQLGLGTTSSTKLPIRIIHGGVSTVIAGGDFSMFIKDNATLDGGTLCVMGDNSYGQLGLGDNPKQTVPVEIAGSVADMAAGAKHSLYLTTDGSLFAMGYNYQGQLGLGNNTNQDIPTLLSSSGISSIFAGSNQSFICRQEQEHVIHYVDTHASGANDGTSWADAFINLQDALAAAGVEDEIWVAKGIYKPSVTGDRIVSFEMKGGVSVYGGFAGTEESREQRNWESNPTVLSGDVNKDESLDGNSYHVVISNDAGHPILDGFTISGGNGDGLSSESFDKGAAIFYSKPMVLSNCTITGNMASRGSALYNAMGRISNCSFTGNGDSAICSSYVQISNSVFTSENGIGRYAPEDYEYSEFGMLSGCTFQNCTELRIRTTMPVSNCFFSENSLDMTARLKVDDCTFRINSGSLSIFSTATFSKSEVIDGNLKIAVYGKVRNVECRGGSTEIVVTSRGEISGLVVSNSTAGTFLEISGGNPTFLNCLFYKNEGGISETDSDSIFLNCTYAKNKAPWELTDTTSDIRNCILWNNNPDGSQIVESNSQLSVENSCIMNEYAGQGNISLNPEFIDFPNNDFHLRTVSPCIDMGTSVNAPIVDLDGNPRDSLIDMGCYEVSAAEMNVSKNGTDIVSGDFEVLPDENTNYGEVRLADIESGHFQIESIGVWDLLLTEGSTVEIYGEDAADFTLDTAPATVIAAGTSSPFTISFTPSVVGIRNAAVRILNNDADENPYEFAIQGTGVTPEIDVKGNSVPIISGSAAPSPDNDTDFRNSHLTTETISKTFTIANPGTAALNLVGTPMVAISDADDFKVTTQPSTSIAPSAATTFTITFDPSALGLRSATVTIATDDLDESSYTFTIQGTGVVPAIDMIGQSQIITNGSISATPDNGTDFEEVLVDGASITMEYRIANSGNSTLLLTGSEQITISGTGAGDFAVAAVPSSSIDVDSEAPWAISFTPSEPGLRTATVTIENNDPENSPFVFAVQGTGVSPEITITDQTTAITAGDMNPSIDNHTDFGNVNLYTGLVSWDFVIENNGTSVLNLGNPSIFVSGPAASDFIVTAPSTSSVAPSSSIPFNISFNPSAIGLCKATITVSSDDLDEGEYSFAIQGTGIAQDIEATGSGEFEPEYVVGDTQERQITIQNTGNDTLQLDTSSSITITGRDAGDFSFDPLVITSIEPNNENNSIQLTINFDPQDLGTRTATLSIVSDDLDESPVVIPLNGTGLNHLPVAIATSNPAIPMPQDVIVLSAASSSDPDNYPISPLTYSWEFISGPAPRLDLQPVTDDAVEVSWSTSINGVYLFKLTVSDGADSVSSEIEIIVGDALQLVVPSELREGTDRTVQCQLRISRELESPLDVSLHVSDESKILVPTSLTIPKGQKSVPFAVEVVDDEVASGLKYVTITATADRWNAAEKAVSIIDNEGPEINVLGNGILIENGSVTTQIDNETNFGINLSNTAYVDRTFLIKNVGSAELNLTGDPLVSITGDAAGDFEIIQQPGSPIVAAESETSFVIRFIPKEEGGTRRAAISIKTNDPKAPDYQFDIKGETIVIYNPGGALDGGGGCGIAGVGSHNPALWFMLTGVLCCMLLKRLRSTQPSPKN